MKGIVFTEFLEMVEVQFSPEMADAIIEASDLSTAGAYSAVGTYPHAELVQLVRHLSTRSSIPVPDLLRAFGKHLFRRFAIGFPMFFTDVSTVFEFLRGLENYIHVEVRKLYPDAELPTFLCRQVDDQTLEMTYQSVRGLADFAHGLMEGCFVHFGETIDVARDDLSQGRGTEVRFTLTRQ